ncbi:hypothetical protein CFP56_013497 [Quercus suber]|uniref:Uncharacterized protein n=1 Tax=Quercus suber TaxID=58331 RepID=A0AAW0KWD9_QUESU
MRVRGLERELERDFGVFVAPLLLKKSWRHCYFRFCDEIKDRIALLIALRVVHLKRNLGWKKIEIINFYFINETIYHIKDRMNYDNLDTGREFYVV